MATLSGLVLRAPRKNLYDAFQMVSKAVATRSSLPILSHVLIKQDAENGRISMIASDLTMWIEHVLPPSQEKIEGFTTGGAATALSKNLGDLLSALPDGDVDLMAEQSDEVSFALHVRSGKASYKLLGLAPDEFPPVPVLETDTTFRVKTNDFKDAIRQTLFATSTDDTRPILTGILLSYKGGLLRAVATDTHRLAVRELEVVDGSGPDVNAVVPARAMGEALRMSSAEDAFITVVLSQSQVQFRVEDKKLDTATTLTTRLIEGQFPTYERVVPQFHDKRITVQRDWLLSALRRASILAREGAGANRVVLRTERGEGRRGASRAAR
jgi:DNA polymerase-3 subunit beta